MTLEEDRTCPICWDGWLVCKPTVHIVFVLDVLPNVIKKTDLVNCD